MATDDPVPGPPYGIERRHAWRRRRDAQLLQRERELEAARRISEPLFQHAAMDEVLKQALHTAMEVVDAEAGSVLLADPEKHTLVFRYTLGDKPVAPGTTIRCDQGIAGAVFTSGTPQVIADVKADPRHFPNFDLVTGFRTRDMITVPLKRWEGQPIGVLSVLNKRHGRLSSDEVGILTLLGAFAAIAIEQARLYEEAKLAEVVRLLGDISHDLKNLLAPIETGSEFLRREITEVFAALPTPIGRDLRPAHERCDEMLDVLHGSVGRIRHRMQEIADCVKGLSAPPTFAACRIGDVVDDVFQTLGVLAEEQGVTLTADGLDGLPAIVADERRLFNALYNLVNNAIVATPKGGSVKIAACVDEAANQVRLSVVDTGRGMPPDALKTMFTTEAISRKRGGTGLGTKIVKDVVDAHHGRISVESREGAGTAVHLLLPLDPTRVAASPPT